MKEHLSSGFQTMLIPEQFRTVSMGMQHITGTNSKAGRKGLSSASRWETSILCAVLPISGWQAYRSREGIFTGHLPSRWGFSLSPKVIYEKLPFIPEGKINIAVLARYTNQLNMMPLRQPPEVRPSPWAVWSSQWVRVTTQWFRLSSISLSRLFS